MPCNPYFHQRNGNKLKKGKQKLFIQQGKLPQTTLVQDAPDVMASLGFCLQIHALRSGDGFRSQLSEEISEFAVHLVLYHGQPYCGVGFIHHNYIGPRLSGVI